MEVSKILNQPETEAKAARQTNMRLILLVGIPGSGKTTLAKKLVEKGFQRLCADDIREELYGDAAVQGDAAEVFGIFFKRLEQGLQAGKNIVVDNTNMNRKHRQPILQRAKAAGYTDIQLWCLDVPLDVCLARNKARQRLVPEDIVANMFMELNRGGRPQRSEGKIVIIRPGKDENDWRFFFPQD